MGQINKNLKIGDKVLIKKKHSEWSSLCSGEYPNCKDLEFPRIVTIMDLKNDSSHTCFNCELGYGWNWNHDYMKVVNYVKEDYIVVTDTNLTIDKCFKFYEVIQLGGKYWEENNLDISDKINSFPFKSALKPKGDRWYKMDSKFYIKFRHATLKEIVDQYKKVQFTFNTIEERDSVFDNLKKEGWINFGMNQDFLKCLFYKENNQFYCQTRINTNDIQLNNIYKYLNFKNEIQTIITKDNTRERNRRIAISCRRCTGQCSTRYKGKQASPIKVTKGIERVKRKPELLNC